MEDFEFLLIKMEESGESFGELLPEDGKELAKVLQTTLWPLHPNLLAFHTERVSVVCES